MSLLKGKVAVVTGAGRGIGRAVAVALAQEGAVLGLAARSSDEIERVADDIRKCGSRAVAVPTDVGCQENVDTFFARVREELGEVDILVNNAAVTVPFGFLWGSDVPGILCRVTYRQAVDILREHCPFLSSRGKNLILGENALGVYRFTS